MTVATTTISLEDDVADWLRREAARCNTSVPQLVGEFLAEKMREGIAYEKAMREALEFRSLGCSKGRMPTRDETYDRSAG